VLVAVVLAVLAERVGAPGSTDLGTARPRPSHLHQHLTALDRRLTELDRSIAELRVADAEARDPERNPDAFLFLPVDPYLAAARSERCLLLHKRARLLHSDACAVIEE
jgi:hypothetical protein